MSDLRQEKRMQLALKVRFKSTTQNEFIEQYCRDISASGVFIKSKEPMEIGALVKFELQLKTGTSLIRGIGRVVWRRELKDALADYPPGVGIQFIQVSEESHILIEQMIAKRGTKPSRYDQPNHTPSENVEKNVEKKASRESYDSIFPESLQPELPKLNDQTRVVDNDELVARALRDEAWSSAPPVAHIAPEDVTRMMDTADVEAAFAEVRAEHHAEQDRIKGILKDLEDEEKLEDSNQSSSELTKPTEEQKASSKEMKTLDQKPNYVSIFLGVCVVVMGAIIAWLVTH